MPPPSGRKLEAVCFSETLIATYESTRCYIPEEQHRCLKMWTTFKKVMENRMSLVRLDGYKQLMENKLILTFGCGYQDNHRNFQYDPMYNIQNKRILLELPSTHQHIDSPQLRPVPSNECRSGVLKVSTTDYSKIFNTSQQRTINLIRI